MSTRPREGGWWICRICQGFFGDYADVADAANRHEEETGHEVEFVTELPRWMR